MTRSSLWIGNLDAEAVWAGRPLGGDVLSRISHYATLLRFLSGESARVWTPLPVEDECAPPLKGIERAVLLSGPLSKVLPREGENVRAWAWTEDAARVVRRSGGSTVAPSVARDVNDRKNILAWREALSSPLGGECLIESSPALDSHLRSGGTRVSPTGGWVLKARLSAAGRDRLRVRDAGSAPPVENVERFLKRVGSAVFEPWVDRISDFAFLGEIRDRQYVAIGAHRTLVASDGRCVGIGIGGLDLGAEEASALERAAAYVARQLIDRGYHGPFGLDAWRYRTADGDQRFQPLGEVNARCTFGFVARAVRRRLAAAGHVLPDAEFELHFGETPPAGEGIALLRSSWGGAWGIAR